MKNIVLSFLVALFLVVAWSCNEEQFVEPVFYSTVRGQVLFDITRKPAKQVLVRLSPTSRSVETDSLGNFRFDSITAGKYTLQTTLTGYLNEFATIEVADRQSTSLIILLRDDKSQNKPSVSPTLIKPLAGADTLSTTLTLRWKATDPDPTDSLTYDVAIYQEGIVAPVRTSINQKADSLIVKDLAYNTTYYWQVTVKDGIHAVKSDIFSFRTRPFPNFTYVYVRRVNGRYQLFTSNGTGQEIQLTSQGSNWRPVVSPNGRAIAFISNVLTDLHLFIMNLDGSHMQQVTTIPVAGIAPAELSFCWSPDGTQLVYPANDKLYALQTNGTGLWVVAKLSSGHFFSGCDWTEQGNQLVARTSSSDMYDNQMVLVNPQSGATKPLNLPEGRIGNPVFSIDGKQILFSRDISLFKNEQNRQLNARIQLYTLRDSSLTDLTGSSKLPGTNDLEPRFSPNGSAILFTNVDNSDNTKRAIQTTDLNGQARKSILVSTEMPYWR